MRIIVDSREQAPFSFNGFNCEVKSGTLSSGDYSIAGFEDIVAIERKSLPDFISCLTTGRERFMREMERLRGFQSAVIVVESPFSDLASGRYRSKLDSKIAVQSVISIMQNYRMPFFFAETRKEAEKFVFDFLRHFCRHALARYKAVSK